MLRGILGSIINAGIHPSDRCVVRSCIETDFDVLRQCLQGTTVDQKNRHSIQRLARVGYVRMGTNITMNDEAKTIELKQTAKATELGSRILQKR